MEKKRKVTRKLLIFGIVFMLFSCSENLYEDHFSHSKIKTQKVSLNDDFLKQNSKLMKSVNQIKSLNNKSYHKIIYDSINDFYIDDENGIFLDYNGSISYSFRVLRDDTTESSKVENIVFNQIETGDYDSYLLKYAFSKTELDALTFEGANTINYEIEDVDVLISNKTTAPKCRTIRISKCGDSGTEWDCGGGICGYDYVIQCDEGGGGSNNGSGSSGGVNTLPTGGGTTAVANPCKKIKKQIDKFASLKPALVTLKGTTSQNHENGIYIDNTATATTPNPIQNLPTITAQGVSAIDIPNLPAPSKYKIIAHTHDAVGPNNTGTFSIFSWGDLKAIAEKIRLGQIDTDNFVFYVITADNTIYALTIDWPSIFSEYFDVSYVPDNPALNFNGKKAIELNKTEKKYYNDSAVIGSGKIGLATNATDDLKIFLQMLKDTKLDVSLFEVDPTFTTYTKKTLSNNGTVTSGTHCN